MTRPEELTKNEPLMWSTGTGADVWEMFQTAIAGNLDTIRRLLDKDPSLVRGAYQYRTALSFAVRENQLAAAQLLLDRGANPMSSGSHHGSLLDIARDRGYAEMEKLLETTLARVHGVSPRAETLAAAIRERDLAKMRALLDASPELLEAGDARGNRPIHWAAMTRQPELIDELLARGADIDARRPDGARPIHLFDGDYHYRGWRDVPDGGVAAPAALLAHLIARGADVDIWTAAHMGNLERVRELLDRDPSLANRVSDYNSYYLGCGSALRNAAAKGHLEIVKLLLDRGADPNLPQEHIAPRGHALYSAVYNGRHDIARLLLERGAWPNAPVESSADPLSIAHLNSDRQMIELLASYGAARSVSILAYYGDVETAAAVFAVNPALADDPEALSNAAEEGHEPFIRLLLRYQPGLPARVAVAAKTAALTRLLFEHGMNPNLADWLGITPLHRFSRKGDVENAALFIGRGADLEARDEDLGSTPLAWAACFGKLPLVELLLERGATQALAGDPPWTTPLAWAIRRGHVEVAGLLRSKMR